MNIKLSKRTEKFPARALTACKHPTKRAHLFSLPSPSIEKQMDVIKENIDILRDSFMERFGPLKGQVTDPVIADEIDCLEATLRILAVCDSERSNYGLIICQKGHLSET